MNSKSPHIVFRRQTGELCCLACEKAERSDFPMEVQAFVDMAKRFISEHENCVGEEQCE